MKKSVILIVSIIILSMLSSCVGNFQYYDVGKTEGALTTNQNSEQINNTTNDNAQNKDINKASNDSTKADIHIEMVDVKPERYEEYFEDMRYPKISCNNNEALDKNLKKLSSELEEQVIGDRNMNTEFIGNSLDQGIQLDEWTKFSNTIDAEVTANDGKYLSILLKMYSYSGGAHPNYVLIGHTYDIATGKETDLYDFVKGKEELRTFLKKWVDENQADGLYDDAKDTVDKYIDNPKGEFELEYEIDYHIDYYLNNDGLHVVFQAYELAPYAYGIVDIVLDKSLLK